MNTLEAFHIEGGTLSAYYDFNDECDFGNCVTVPEGVTTIGAWAFYDSRSLLSVIGPHGVTTIHKNAFGDCKRLQAVIISDSVTGIDDEAFGDNRNATIYAPAGSAAEAYANDHGIPFRAL